MPKNVVDWYQDWYDDDIIADLDNTRLPLIIVAENVNGDFHKANILRTAEGFNVRAFFVLGKKKMDMRGAVGSHNRLKVQHIEHLDELTKYIPNFENYEIVTVDNVPGAKSVIDYSWYPNTIMIFGEEQRGVTSQVRNSSDSVVYIPMLGAVRSFSVSTAAGIAMYDYCNQLKVL